MLLRKLICFHGFTLSMDLELMMARDVNCSYLCFVIIIMSENFGYKRCKDPSLFLLLNSPLVVIGGMTNCLFHVKNLAT